MDAIVPAYNEAATVGTVVQALVLARVFGRVVVVDDGSTDDTASAAAAAGAQVLPMPQNGGKGAAMLAGARAAAGDVAFFDADLVGFQADHARSLVHAYTKGYDMVCGLRDYRPLGNMLQATMGPIITGERIVRRWILDALPESCWDGYSIETGMNFICNLWGGKIALIPMAGVQIRTKLDKGGVLKGLRGQMSMFSEIAATKHMLTETGGAVCKI